jgi:hypothetical protein
VKYDGRDTPARATPIAPRSKTVPLRRADRIPALTPKISHRTDAPRAMLSVTGRRLISCGRTCCAVAKLKPRQGASQRSAEPPPAYSRPTNRPLKKSPYWVCPVCTVGCQVSQPTGKTGRSRPSFFSISCCRSRGQPLPQALRAGFAGKMAKIPNVITLITNRMITTPIDRRMM